MAPAVALPWVIMGSMAASTAMSAFNLIKGTPKPPEQDPRKKATEAAYATAERLKVGRGQASTILTGPLGVTDPPKTTQATLGG